MKYTIPYLAVTLAFLSVARPGHAQSVTVTPAVTHCSFAHFTAGIQRYQAVNCAELAKKLPGAKRWSVTHEQNGVGPLKADIRTVYESSEVDKLMKAQELRIVALEQTLESLKAMILSDAPRSKPEPSR